MNLLREPSFELGGRYWTLDGHARVSDANPPRTGIASAAVWITAAGIGGGLTGGGLRQAVPTLPGRKYRASVWVRPSGTPGCNAQLIVKSPSTSGGVGLDVTQQVIDEWMLLEGTYVAAGEDTEVILTVGDPMEIGLWFFDDASLELDMSSRRDEIRQALLSALSGINGQDPYETQPREVIGYARQPRAFPALHISDEDEVRELRGYQAVTAALAFQVVALTGKFDTDDKIDELDKLIADVERAIGQDPTLGLGEYGTHAVITEVSVVRGLDGEVGGLAVLKVETPYRFSRGEP